MTDTEDRELRALLHDAVADVEPTRTPDHLHARLDRQPRRAWVPLTVAAAVVTALVLVGVPWLVDRGPSAPPAATPAAAVEVVAYAVADVEGVGPRLAPDRRTVEGSPDDVLQLAVEQTLGGTPADPDVDRVTDDGDLSVVATRTEGGVDLDLAGYRPVAEDEMTGLLGASLIWAAATAVGDPEAQIRFLANGEPLEVAFGFNVADPTSATEHHDVLATVVVESVGEGQVVTSPFTVSGLASAFEGTVVWRLLDGDEVVRDGFTTAAECCTPAPYSFEVDAPPGDYVLEVGDTDPSDGEGFPAYVDTKSVTVE